MIITDNKAFSGYNLPWCIFNFAAGLIQFSLGCVSFWVRNKYSETVKQEFNDHGLIDFIEIDEPIKHMDNEQPLKLILVKCRKNESAD